jgi:hypothetical protein
MTEQEDWAAAIDPPSADDGPQQPVDWRLLEEAGHPVVPDGYEDDELAEAELVGPDELAQANLLPPEETDGDDT